jgi:hypothetical protein
VPGHQPLTLQVIVGHHRCRQAPCGLVELQVDAVAVDEDVQPGGIVERCGVFLRKARRRAEQELVRLEVTALEPSVLCLELCALRQVDDLHGRCQVGFHFGIGDGPAGSSPWGGTAKSEGVNGRQRPAQ